MTSVPATISARPATTMRFSPKRWPSAPPGIEAKAPPFLAGLGLFRRVQIAEIMHADSNRHDVLITDPRDMKGFVAELKKRPFAYMTGVNVDGAHAEYMVAHVGGTILLPKGNRPEHLLCG